MRLARSFGKVLRKRKIRGHYHNWHETSSPFIENSWILVAPEHAKGIYVRPSFSNSALSS